MIVLLLLRWGWNEMGVGMKFYVKLAWLPLRVAVGGAGGRRSRQAHHHKDPRVYFGRGVSIH